MSSIDFKIGMNRYAARTLINFLFSADIISGEAYLHADDYVENLKVQWKKEGYMIYSGNHNWAPRVDIKHRLILHKFILKLEGCTTKPGGK